MADPVIIDCMAPLLETEDLTRAYGPFRALAPTSLVLEPGDVVSLAGHNGAGKSTLLLCLSGLLRPTAGKVRVEGYDLYHDEIRAKSRLAFVPDVPRFYTELTAWEHLQFMAAAHGVSKDFAQRAEALMKEFDIWRDRNLYPHNYSRGMRLKLGLLMAFIRPFSVLLLDEPTSALDLESIHLLKHKLLDLRDAGAAVLFSSHDPDLAVALGAARWRMEQGVLSSDGDEEESDPGEEDLLAEAGENRPDE
jgi:ABC-2 type transport system ATP-binding protein